MRQMLFFIALTAGLLAGAQANGLPTPIAEALFAARIPDSHVGIEIRTLDLYTPDLSFGEQRPINPASVMKIVTTLAALDNLGPNHRFKTQVLTQGSLADGVLYGDLVIRGGGDPSLSVERFWLLIKEVRARGVREIRGDVILDDSYFAIETADPGAFDGAPLKAYNAVPNALLVNYNVVALRVTPLAQGVTARLDPGLLTLDSKISLDSQAPCNGWGESLSHQREQDVLRLGGAYPLACGDKMQWLNLAPPAATTAAYFKSMWAEAGGTLSGQIRIGPATDSAISLFEFESLPLAEIIRDTNKHSNNVMAKMLFLNHGATRLGAPATWEKGDRAIRDWLKEKKLDMPELIMENGSGLSRNERISAASMAKLLVWAAKQPLYYEFAASLPALGLEGTVKKRLTGTPEAGRAWLKTGSLNGARALAGYVLDTSGRRKVVVLFINHPNAKYADGFQNAVLRWAMTNGANTPDTEKKSTDQ